MILLDCLFLIENILFVSSVMLFFNGYCTKSKLDLQVLFSKNKHYYIGYRGMFLDSLKKCGERYKVSCLQCLNYLGTIND